MINNKQGDWQINKKGDWEINFATNFDSNLIIYYEEVTILNEYYDRICVCRLCKYSGSQRDMMFHCVSKKHVRYSSAYYNNINVRRIVNNVDPISILQSDRTRRLNMKNGARLGWLKRRFEKIDFLDEEGECINQEQEKDECNDQRLDLNLDF